MKHHRHALLLLSFALLAGCAATDASRAMLHGDVAHPAQAQGWVESQLYFGLGPAGEPAKGISEAAWQAFLDAEVTPRFPDGFSVLDAYGQWQGVGQSSPERLRSRVLVVVHPDTADARARVDAIRAAWKQRTGDQSVLRVTHTAEVSF